MYITHNNALLLCSNINPAIPYWHRMQWGMAGMWWSYTDAEALSAHLV